MIPEVEAGIAFNMVSNTYDLVPYEFVGKRFGEGLEWLPRYIADTLN